MKTRLSFFVVRYITNVVFRFSCSLLIKQHFSMERMSFCTNQQSFSLSTLRNSSKSSASIGIFKLFIHYGKSFTNIKTKSGSRLENCGTPDKDANGSDTQFENLTWFCRLSKYFLYHAQFNEHNPYSFNLIKSIWWSTL